MKLCDEFGVERWQLGFGVFECVCWGVLAEPKFHESKEDPIVVEIGGVEHLSLSLPLFAELSGYLFNESGELIELLFRIVAVKKVEVGVVVDLAFF
jgi:hypothetical protein